MNASAGTGSRWRRLWARLRGLATGLVFWLARLVPGARTRRGAVVGTYLAVLLVAAWNGTLLRNHWGAVPDALLMGLIAAGLLAVGTVVATLALTVAARLPRWTTGALVAAVIVVQELLQLPGRGNGVLFWMVVMPALIGGAVAALTAPAFRDAPRFKRLLVPALLVAALGAFVWLFVFLAQRGTEEGLLKVAEAVHEEVPTLEAPDPGLPGPYPVQTLTYGSGEDPRPEYGEAVDLRTEPIDAKPFVNRIKGWKARLRNSYWGFDRRDFPVNGRVWYPEGEGPFPLVLIVHGNHSMRDYSDPGYGYLGELLASRGFILVSVDENFLNGDWTDNYRTENDARGWVLLEHLRVWREWNGSAENPFAGRVDLSRIAIMGHSRGGEAVAVAAAFNRLTHYPDDATVTFDYDFDIRGVVAIAPVDGQYRPADQYTPLGDVDYLLLHGSHDGDVSSFSGDRTWKRITFSPESPSFKTSLYIYRANHGQFNTVWGDSDWGMPGGLMLNRAALLDAEDQRRIARVWIGAFLETVLHERTEYRPMFRDWRTARHWLPETYYIGRYADAQVDYVADYGEDIDVLTGTLAGTRLEGERLATWREEDIGFRSGSSLRDNQAVYLGWRPVEVDTLEAEETDDEDTPLAGGPEMAPDRDSAETLAAAADTLPAVYRVRLPEGLSRAWSLGPEDALVFSTAQVDEKPKRPDEDDELVEKEKEERKKARKEEEEHQESMEDQENQNRSTEGVDKQEESTEDNESTEDSENDEEGEKEPLEPLDWTIICTDALGRTAELALSQVYRLMPPFKAKFTRLKSLEGRYGKSSEPVLQSIEIPLARFQEAAPAFDPRRLVTVCFRFDRSEQGVIVLDEIGFRRVR
jgi:dienelactone hydrolase